MIASSSIGASRLQSKGFGSRAASRISLMSAQALPCGGTLRLAFPSVIGWAVVCQVTFASLRCSHIWHALDIFEVPSRPFIVKVNAGITGLGFAHLAFRHSAYTSMSISTYCLWHPIPHRGRLIIISASQM